MATECKRIFLILLMCFHQALFAQERDSVFEAGPNFTSVEIPHIRIAFVPVDFDVQKSYSPDLISEKGVTSNKVPPGKVSSKILFRFAVWNSTEDSSSFYFFPGFYFPDNRLYRLVNDSAISIPVESPEHKDNLSYRKFTLAPGDTAVILAEVFQSKTYNNIFKPRVIHEPSVNSFINELPLGRKSEALFTYFLCGLLMMMILFSLANYFQGRNREFLYYALYALFMGFMLFTKPFYYNRAYIKHYFYEEYLDFILQGLGICFYMVFMIRFLETRQKHPFLHNVYRVGITGLLISLAVYTFLHFGSEDYYWQNFLENYIVKIALLVLILLFLVYAVLNWKEILLRFLFWGNLFFLILSTASLFIIFLRGTFNLPRFWTSALIWYEIGLLVELIFFMMALTYKNRKLLIEQIEERERLKRENDRKEIEKQMAVWEAHQKERQRISEDMHDELGSGMTTIRLMSEIAKSKMKQSIPVEIEKISSNANDLLNKMNAIIWSMNSQNDTVDNLVAYIRSYSLEYFDATGIHCKVSIPGEVSKEKLAGDKRRNIFLAFKESLNNVLKHSGTKDIHIRIVTDSELNIQITDSGKGFDPANTQKYGNGLKNIKRRMKSIGGFFSIESENGKGTTTTLGLPIT